MSTIILLESGHTPIPSSIEQQHICHESVRDNTTGKVHKGEVLYLSGDTLVLQNWVKEQTIPLWHTTNPMVGWDKYERQEEVVPQNAEPQFRISQSEIAEFNKWYKSQTGLRYGQAFHQYFKLDKKVSDKTFCDRLYEMDFYEAKKAVTSITDYNN